MAPVGKRIEMMPTLRVRIYGDPALRERCAPVRRIDAELRELAKAMAETLYELHGIGLAAPQVGISQRLFVADVDWIQRDGDGKKSSAPRPKNLRVYVNPEITWESAEDVRMVEGCLSIPGVEGEIYRPARIKVRYEDLAGLRHEDLIDGLLARCVHHEVDHLDGVLFVDRLPFAKRTQIAAALRRLKKQALAASSEPAPAVETASPAVGEALV